MESKMKSLVLLSACLSTMMLHPTLGSAEEIEARIQEVSGTNLVVEVEGEWLPAVGDKGDIYVILAGVGKAQVGTAKVIASSDEQVSAKVVTSTGTLRVGQAMTIQSRSPTRRSGNRVPALIGRSGARCEEGYRTAGLVSQFQLGIAAPEGVKSLTVYAQDPDAGKSLASWGRSNRHHLQ